MARKKLDPRTIDIPKDILKQLYIEDKLTIVQIATKLGYSVTPVWRSLKRHNIKLKPSGGQYSYHDKGITLKKLKHLYLKRQLSIRKIAEIFKCNKSCITTALKHFDISIRSQSEANKLSAPKRVWAKNGHGRNWQGGRSRTLNGYILIYQPDHQRAHYNGYIYEHILVWEKTHGKALPKGWIVHHLNGIRDDNRPENLGAMSRGVHRDLAKPYKERIRQLEAEFKELQQLKLVIA